jgi:electron transport complex protein RnfB
MVSIFVAVAFMSVLGLMLASILVLANKRLFVFEDPRIDQVEELLPHANCGACGTAGCRPFAELLVKREIEPGKCTVNSKDMNQVIANFLGVAMGNQEKQVARLACAGGSHVAYIRASYGGINSCRAAAMVSGGGKGCTWGCLGLGDCEQVCDFKAIHMNRYGLPIVSESDCTACNDCVEVCPKDLFSLQPVSHQLWVACKNQEFGDEAEAECSVICTACGRCAQDSPRA